MEIKNLKKAAERIIKAIEEKEKIIIYGDSDMDGVCSVILLKECIRNLGGENTLIYFPDRETDGYALTKKALKKLEKESPALFVTLDFSLTGFEELEIAKKMGFEMIVIDHHDILDKNPPADIFVNPKQKGDKYPFKLFANVGIVYRLGILLLKDKMTVNLRKDLLELATMATIADMMPREQDNEEIVIEGLSSLKDSWRPGIQALFALESIKPLSLVYQVNKMNSLLNIRDIENELPVAYRLLTISNLEEAGKIVEDLLERSEVKKRMIGEILSEIKRRISAKKEPVVLEGHSTWELILLGIVASILADKHKKPFFLYRKGKEESQGSIRTFKGDNVVKAMQTCHDYLENYGGHPQAAGFKIKNKNLEKFKECLIEYYE
ncbi:DHH family phosphoesterase [Patescibacteria group bacterium]|nr:DHH family phosphoesterase [Patescibacteria group bacterium]